MGIAAVIAVVLGLVFCVGIIAIGMTIGLISIALQNLHIVALATFLFTISYILFDKFI